MTESQVKPLEWRGRKAETSLGTYTVGTVGIHHGWVLTAGTGWNHASDELSAKAAAQADYEARIRSALLPTTRDSLLDEMAKALGKPGMLVYLDGRNEHGSHVIPSYPMTADISQEDASGHADDILRAAEALGYQVGDHVWTEWLWVAPQIGDFGRVELEGYWEFRSVNKPMTDALTRYKNAQGGSHE